VFQLCMYFQREGSCVVTKSSNSKTGSRPCSRRLCQPDQLCFGE